MMLVGLAELQSWQVESSDGPIGRLVDVIFSRGEWVVRYVVAWSEDLDRRIALPPSCLKQQDRNARVFAAEVARNQIEASPDLDLSERMERQDEKELYEWYGWPPYWLQDEQDVTPTGVLSGRPERTGDADEAEFHSPDLQFATDLPDAYAVHANEGEAGVVQDVVVDDETWQIQYLAVQILSKRHSVLIETDGVSEVDWIAKDIYVSLPVSTIVEGPVYHRQEPLTAQRRRDVHAYYRQPHRGP